MSGVVTFGEAMLRLSPPGRRRAAGFLHRLLRDGTVAEALACGRAPATPKLTVPGDAHLLAGGETRMLR
jgi:hypothetical protein